MPTLLQVVEGHKALVSMEPLALAKLFEIAEKQPFDRTPSRAVSFEAAFVVWTYNAIASAELLTPTALFQFIKHYAPGLRVLGYRYQNALKEEEPVLTTHTIAISDRQFASLSNDDNWLNLRDGKPYASCPATFEGVSYNLAILATQEWKRTTKQKEPTDGPQQANTGDSAGSGDAGNSAGDTGS